MTKIDLNCDLGESFGRYTLGLDEEVLPYITSANIACGFHAGDPEVMQQTVTNAEANHVELGAHPGLRDLQGFGRRKMAIAPATAKAEMKYQIGALMAFSATGKLHHVKPHGALYNMAAKDTALATAICEGITEVDDSLILVALANGELARVGREKGLRVAQEVFADRQYEADGSLVSRTKPNAMVTDEDEAVSRVIKMITQHEIVAVDGSKLAITPDTICVHGDGVKAVAFVKKIHAALTANKIDVVAM